PGEAPDGQRCCSVVLAQGEDRELLEFDAEVGDRVPGQPTVGSRSGHPGEAAAGRDPAGAGGPGEVQVLDLEPRGADTDVGRLGEPPFLAAGAGAELAEVYLDLPRPRSEAADQVVGGRLRYGAGPLDLEPAAPVAVLEDGADA